MPQVLDQRAPQDQAVAAFARDVGCDLLRSPKQLQPKYLYDDLGSALFDAICRLPWYPVTRAEMRLLRQHGDEVLGAIADGAHVLELGCGSGEKLGLLVEAFVRRRRPVHVDLIDISEAGESIWTESSYKYEPDQVEAMASLAGFRRLELWWIEPDARFSLTLLRAT